MPKLARLYLDTARLGLMSPGAQLAARDFARLAGEGVSTLYFQNLLSGRSSPSNAAGSEGALAPWTGIDGIKRLLRPLLGLQEDAPVLFATRGMSLMRLAARQLWKRCRRVLIPDTAWPPYVNVVEAERSRAGGEVVGVSIRKHVQYGGIDSCGLINCLSDAYVRHHCDGLFLAAVSHDGVRIPAAPLLTALRRKAAVRLAVIDGAQELAHVPVNLAAVGCDLWLAGAHKWLGGHQPLGIACLANSESAPHLFQTVIDDCHADNEDPLLRFLLRVDGHRIPDVRETVNLAPLFSTWGALRDAATDGAIQAWRFDVRKENATLVGRIVRRLGWESLAISPSLITGIVILRATDRAIRRLPAAVLEIAIEKAGLALTALDGGRLRLSLPARPLNIEHQIRLVRTLATIRREALVTNSDSCYAAQ